MLEYFAYKKFKKHKAEKEKGKNAALRDGQTPGAAEVPVLTDDDERFLEQLTISSADPEDEDEGPRPALPPRVRTPDLSWDSDTESFRGPAEVKRPEDNTSRKKANRISLFQRKNKKAPKDGDLDPTKLSVPEPEVDHERDDLSRVLDNLNLSAKNNKAFSLSDESTELVRRFTLVLKDLVNGVPTAANDLTSLLDDQDGTLGKNYEKLPKSFKKFITQLPEKLGGAELLAAATAAGAAQEDGTTSKGGLKGAAKKLLVPKNLSDLVTKPGAVVGILKGIMNALKMRWPAFIGTNILWSVAIFSKSQPYSLGLSLAGSK